MLEKPRSHTDLLLTFSKRKLFIIYYFGLGIVFMGLVKVWEKFRLRKWD